MWLVLGRTLERKALLEQLGNPELRDAVTGQLVHLLSTLQATPQLVAATQIHLLSAICIAISAVSSTECAAPFVTEISECMHYQNSARRIVSAFVCKPMRVLCVFWMERVQNGGMRHHCLGWSIYELAATRSMAVHLV